MAAFDNSFDRTFIGGGIAAPVNFVSPINCGITLMWLTLQGWCFWDFEANTETRIAVKKQTSYFLNRLQRSTHRIAGVSYVLRTGNLTEAESRKISGVIVATSVYWIKDRACYPVFVETTELALWTQLQTRTGLEISISVPYIESLRK